MKITSIIEELPSDVATLIAQRAKSRRLQFGLTREVLAERAAVSAETIKRFESTGRITLETLLRLCFALEALRDFDGVLRSGSPRTLSELEARVATRGRMRGRRKDAGLPRNAPVRLATDVAVKDASP